MELTTKPLVLIVDDAPDNLMLIKMLLQGRCRVQQASNGALALQLAQSEPHPDLILLDVLMPELDGYTTCAELRANPATSDIPVIFLTSRNQIEDQRRGFQAGAVDYITKPINPDVLQARVSTHLQLKALRAMLKDQSVHLEHLVQERVRDIDECEHTRSLLQAAHASTQTVDNDPYTCRLQHYVAALARQLQTQPQMAGKISDGDIALLFRATYLHDVNAQAISSNALDAISQQFVNFAQEIISHQNENYDGSGAPAGLVGDAIPLAARLVRIAKVYDHLISNRDYKPALSHAEAMAILREQRSKHFDPDMIDAALAISDQLQAISHQYAQAGSNSP